MQLPNIPTDNLYKFLSISGLWMFLVFLFIPHYFIHISLDKKRTLELSDKILNIESESLSTESIEIENAIKVLKNKLEVITKEEAYKTKDILNLVNKLEDRNHNNITLLKELRIARAKQEASLDEAKYYADQLTWFISIRNSGVFLGFLLSFWGFIAWYCKIQCVEDKLRYKEIEKNYKPRKKSRFLSIRKIR